MFPFLGGATIGVGRIPPGRGIGFGRIPGIGSGGGPPIGGWILGTSHGYCGGPTCTGFRPDGSTKFNGLPPVYP